MLAEELDVVVGVDTRKHTHTAAAVMSTGAVVEHVTVAANPKGYRALMAFGHRQGRRGGPSREPAVSAPV